MAPAHNFQIPLRVTIQNQIRVAQWVVIDEMLVNTYAHIQQSSRVELGKKFESGFYAKPDASSPQAVPAAGEPTISMTALLELLKDADPEMKAKLRLALLT